MQLTTRTQRANSQCHTFYRGPQILTMALFVNFAVPGLTSIRQLRVPLLHLSLTPILITVILSAINSIIPSPTDPELSCSYYRLSS